MRCGVCACLCGTVSACSGACEKAPGVVGAGGRGVQAGRHAGSPGDSDAWVQVVNLGGAQRHGLEVLLHLQAGRGAVPGGGWVREGTGRSQGASKGSTAAGEPARDICRSQGARRLPYARGEEVRAQPPRGEFTGHLCCDLCLVDLQLLLLHAVGQPEVREGEKERQGRSAKLDIGGAPVTAGLRGSPLAPVLGSRAGGQPGGRACGGGWRAGPGSGTQVPAWQAQRAAWAALTSPR
jgi:hypothetical protein